MRVFVCGTSKAPYPTNRSRILWEQGGFPTLRAFVCGTSRTSYPTIYQGFWRNKEGLREGRDFLFDNNPPCMKFLCFFLFKERRILSKFPLLFQKNGEKMRATAYEKTKEARLGPLFVWSFKNETGFGEEGDQNWK